MVGKLHGRPCEHRACDGFWRKCYALGGKYQDKALGVCVFPPSVALLRSVVASLFLLLAQRNAVGCNFQNWESLNDHANRSHTKSD